MEAAYAVGDVKYDVNKKTEGKKCRKLINISEDRMEEGEGGEKDERGQTHRTMQPRKLNGYVFGMKATQKRDRKEEKLGETISKGEEDCAGELWNKKTRAFGKFHKLGRI